MLSASELAVIRGDRCLFQEVEFSLQPEELLLVEGPNGSGKTSLLRALVGLAEFAEGEVLWHGKPVKSDYFAFRGDLAWLAHKTGFKSDLSIIENLAFEAGVRSWSVDTQQSVLKRLSLSLIKDLPFRVLSAGQQRRVALARLLLADAPLWVMDEPFTNLDSAGRDLVTELIESHLSAGGLAVVASHQAVNVAGRMIRLRLGS